MQFFYTDTTQSQYYRMFSQSTTTYAPPVENIQIFLDNEKKVPASTSFAKEDQSNIITNSS
ncbi:hypothetical protein, partial [Flavobacterium sp. SaA2.13]|uniref:hypothetical protein n=1 Tax=Flavobacterium sp. SaA2.13 TaxID=2691898 RepID=UPI001CEF63AC